MIVYAVAATLALFFLIPFFTAVCRKKRIRRGYDVLYIITGAVLSVVLLAIAAFAVVQAYEPFGISVSGLPNGKRFIDLVITRKEKKLFSLPYLGNIIPVCDKLQPYIVYGAFAEFVLCLSALIAVGVKTYRVKKNKKNRTEAAIATESVIPVTRQTESEETSTVAADVQTQPLKTLSDAVPQEELSDESVRNIVNEIDTLVTGAPQTAEDSEIDDALKRAIREGYALMENGASDPVRGDVNADTATVGDPVSHRVVEETQNTAQKQDLRGEQEPEKKEEVWAFEAEERTNKEERSITEQEIELVPDYDGRTKNRGKVVAVEKAERISDPESLYVKPVGRNEYGEYIRTSVRTIIRHASARNSVKRKTQPDTASATETKTMKTVVAESGGLPLTRKYVILNRRSAATVFTDYLNSKREQEKVKITNSLNTIIMK